MGEREGEARSPAPGRRLYRLGAGSAEVRGAGGERHPGAAHRRRRAGEASGAEAVAPLTLRAVIPSDEVIRRRRMMPSRYHANMTSCLQFRDENRLFPPFFRL